MLALLPLGIYVAIARPADVHTWAEAAYGVCILLMLGNLARSVWRPRNLSPQNVVDLIGQTVTLLGATVGLLTLIGSADR